MSKGRHRKPTNTKRHAQRVAVGGMGVLVVTGAYPTAPGRADELPVVDPFDVIAECESGGDPRAQNPTSTASGLFQIIDGTWEGAGGLEFAPTAAEATPEEQRIVAERIAAAAGDFSDWDASKSCWGDEIDGPPQQPIEPPGEPVVEPSPIEDVFPTEEIPVVEEPPTEPIPAVDGETITVQPGDTLNSIYPQVDLPHWQRIVDVNPEIVNPDLIYVGQLLDLPAEATYHGGRHRAPEEHVVPIPSLPPVPTAAEAPVDEPASQAEAQAELDQQANVGAVNPLASMTVTSPFLQQRNGYKHRGVDLRAPLGTMVYAPVDLEILEAEPASGCGWWVLGRASDGTTHVFCHFYGPDVYVVAGQSVPKGSVIALTGDNGSPGQPHLHWEVHPGDWSRGATSDPLAWLANAV